MADNISELTTPYFTDGSTQLNAQNLNPIVAKINEVIRKMNGDSPSPTPSVTAPTIYIRDLAIIMAAESGASIYYTTDGSTPTANSTQYTNAFTLPNNATVKAIAIKNGSSSSVTTASFTAPQTSEVANPQIVIEGDKATILNNGLGVLKYKIDDGSYADYSAPVTLSSACTITASCKLPADTTALYATIVYTGEEDIATSVRYESKFANAYIDRNQSTSSTLYLANDTTSTYTTVRFMKIASGRKYAMRFKEVSGSSAPRGFYGYANTIPSNIDTEQTIAGKYDSSISAPTSFSDVTDLAIASAEDFQYLVTTNANHDNIGSAIREIIVD